MKKIKKIIDLTRRIVLMTATLIIFQACNEPFNLKDLLDGVEISSLRVIPQSAKVSYSETFNLIATGGVPPLTFQFINIGSGAPSLDEETGEYVSGDVSGVDIVRVTDQKGNTIDATITVSSLSSNVDYNSIDITNTGGTLGGSDMDGTFYFTNSGSGNGTVNVEWNVYISLNDTIGSGDIIIDSGTTSPLTSGDTSLDISFSGTWPLELSDTTYYLIVHLSASDEQNYSDNYGTLSVIVTAPLPTDIDYTLLSITNAPASAEIDTSLTQSFTYKNQGSVSGVFPVSWKSYFSTDTILDIDDEVFNQRSESSLTPSSEATVDITGNWPSTPGVYYLIVVIEADDDTVPGNNKIVSAPFTISDGGSNADYVMTNLSMNYPHLSSGALCSETFSIANLGGATGDVISWKAYASLDNILDRDTDFEIGTSGSFPLGALPAGDSYNSIPISGSWPDTAEEYYLFVEIEAAGDDTSNNILTRGLFTLHTPPDYIISSTTTLLTEGTPDTALGSPGDFEFIIENTSSSGIQQIGWEVFASTNTVLDGGDSSLKSGMVPALTGGQSTGAIGFDDALWPEMGSYYYLIISITAGDEINSINNTWVSPSPLFVPSSYIEGAEDNSYDNLFITDFAKTSDISSSLLNSVLSPYELIRVSGLNEDKLNYDTYMFSLDSGVTTVGVKITWNTGINGIDFKLWEGSLLVVSSEEKIANSEPGDSPLEITGLTEGGDYYLGVYFNATSAVTSDEPYEMLIYGKP